MKTRSILIILLLSFTLALTAEAKHFKVNRDYGGIYMVPVPQVFTLTLPEAHTKTIYPTELKEKNTYAKFQFFTPQKQLKEDLTLKYMKIPLGDKTERLFKIKNELISWMGQIPNASMIAIKQAMIGPYDVLIIQGQTNNYYISLIGILNPKSHHNIKARINVDPRLSEVKNSQKLNSKGTAWQTLQTFKYGRELM